MKPVEPLSTVGLFPLLHAELVALLKRLGGEDWDRPAARRWSVKDVAAHLLDGDVRRLSFQRDQHPPPQPDAPLADYRSLVDFLNGLNADWVKACRRISPTLLIAFLEATGPQVCRFFERLDPHAPALFPVAWAGEAHSPNWFDLAREYTEKWHHQQQIRDAVGAPGLTSRAWLHPVLDTFLRGLPHRYRDVEAGDGASLTLHISGEAGGAWTLARTGRTWRLYAGADPRAAATVRMDQDAAWRLCTKGLTPEQARARIHVEGDEALGRHVLGLTAVMA